MLCSGTVCLWGLPLSVSQTPRLHSYRGLSHVAQVSVELGDGVDIYKLDVDAKDNQELSTGLQVMPGSA